MICNYKQKNSGFSLIEALLTTLVLSGLFLVIFGLLRAYTEQTIARSASNYIEQVSLSIQDILKNPQNFELIYADANLQPNGIREITVGNIISGDIGTTIVPLTSSLSNNFSAQTPFKTGIEIMIRASGGNTLEIIIATDGLVPDQRVRLAAEQSKLNGGFYRNTADGIKSAYNSWRLDPAIDLLGTNWWNNIASVTPPVEGRLSYLVHYKHMVFKDITGDYLYRERVAGRPELNEMYSELDMGGQNILGADDITVLGNVSIESRVNVNGAMGVAGNTNLGSGNFRAYGRLATGTADILGAGSVGPTGNFQVQRAINAGTLALTDELSAETAQFRGGVNMSGGPDTGFNSQSLVGADTVTANNIFTDFLNLTSTAPIDLTVAGQLSAGDIETQSFEIQGTRNMGVIDVKSNNFSLQSNGTANSGVFTSSNITIENLTPATFGACDNGC